MVNQKLKTYFWESIEGVHKSRQAMLHGVIIGLIVGLAVAGFDFIMNDILIKNYKTMPVKYWSYLPLVGFLLTGLITKIGKVENSSMTDEIVHSYHYGDNAITVKSTISKFLGSITTLSFGLTAGLEGASKWVGGMIGVFYARLYSTFPRLEKYRQDTLTSMMSGASAGVGAIFKAPLSGTIMALESPFKKDFAHKPLVQSFVSAVTSYSVYTAFRGSEKFFLINVKYDLRFKDILYAVILGLVCGLISTLLLKTTKKLKRKLKDNKSMSKFFWGGIALFLIAQFSFHFYQSNYSLFSGIDIINKIFNSELTSKMIMIIFLMRFLAFVITFGFGGMGGQFLPSATLGASIGFLIQLVFNLNLPHVFTLLGISSFITASYNGLLFGPVLIAEITGEPNLVVLGIASSCISFLITNGVSNSQFQKYTRDE